MQIRLLGPVSVTADDGTSPALGGPKQRAVLALLALSAGRVVPVDRLVDGVWGERAHDRAAQTLQVYVSTLRKALGTEGARLLVGRRPGYVLQVEPEQVDAAQFLQLAAQGRELLSQGRVDEAAQSLEQALALWRGPALADLTAEPFAQVETVRLEEVRLSATADRVEADLARARHAAVVPELEELVAAHPAKERFWGQLMVALYRDGRQADALGAYGRARRVLADEVGVDPGPALRALERRVLAQDPALAPAVTTAVAATTTGGAPVRRLPRPATPIVGRGREVTRVSELLADPGTRLVTLTGAGGSGKTRLALEVATGSTGAATFVALAEVSDPDFVLPAVARALEVRESGAQPLVETLAAALGDQPHLLVLDNVEQVLAAAPHVAALLAAAPALTVLATSRAALRLRGEHEVPLAPLDVPEEGAALDQVRTSPAVALFTARGRAVRPGFTVDRDNGGRARSCAPGWTACRWPWSSSPRSCGCWSRPPCSSG